MRRVWLVILSLGMITSNSTIGTQETIHIYTHTPCNELTSRTIIASAEVHCHQSICKQLPTLCSPHHEMRNEKGRQIWSQGPTTECESRKFVLNTYNPLHDKEAGTKDNSRLCSSLTQRRCSRNTATSSSDRETLAPLSSREPEQNANPKRWKQGLINGREISDPKLVRGKGKGREARGREIRKRGDQAKEMASSMEPEAETLKP